MWQPLNPPDLENLRPLLDRLVDYNLILTAALEHTTPAQVFVDHATSPRSAFLSTPEGEFLLGAADNEAFNQGLRWHVTEHVFKEDDYIVFEFANPAWSAAIDAHFEARVVVYPRYHYTFKHMKVDWRAGLPEGYVMSPVTTDLLGHGSLKNLPAVAEAITGNWNSVEDFLARGVGMCLLHGETIVSWCLGDCASGQRCEIGIHTDPDYQQRGLATLTVAAAVEQAQARGQTEIGWHCWAHNIASWKLAEKVGFERERQYSASMVLATNTRYFTERGLALSRQGEYKAALEWYDKALTADPTFQWAQVLAGGAHGQLGDTATALAMIADALTQDWPHLDYLRTNTLFAPLRQHPGWQSLLAQYASAKE